MTGCATRDTSFHYYRDTPAAQLMADLHAKQQAEARAWASMDPAIRAEIMREHYEFTHQPAPAPTPYVNWDTPQPRTYQALQPNPGDPILLMPLN